MEFKYAELVAPGTQITLQDDEGTVIARAFIYFLTNGLHKEPFAFMEDVYVEPSLRGQGIGTRLVNHLIELARVHGCYKIVATSRHNRPMVHKLYEQLGFTNHGIEFRIDL